MGKYANLEYELVEGCPEIAVIRFDRPEKLNAFNDALALDFAMAMQEFSDSSAFVAIVTGVGRAFTAGRDVSEVLEKGNKKLTGPNLGGRCNPFWPGEPVDNGHVRRLRKPVIAAVNGYACGLGLLITLAADICIASDEAHFELSEVHRGQMVGWSIGLENGLSRKALMELVFGRRFSAQRAYDMGIVNEVTSSNDLLPTAIDWGKRISAVDHELICAVRGLVDAVRPTVPSQIELLALDLREKIQTRPDVAAAFRSWAFRSGQGE